MTQDQIAPVRCLKCKVPTKLLLYETLWSPNAASYVRIYKCQCGDLVWDDMQGMAKKKPEPTSDADKARTDEARKVVNEHADDQRKLLDKLRRKMN